MSTHMSHALEKQLEGLVMAGRGWNLGASSRWFLKDTAWAQKAL